jgi:hypothetical protein
MNRESEKIITAVVPISVAALIGVFLSVFLFGGEPAVTARFPTVFLYRVSDLQPLAPPDRPLLNSLFEVPTLAAKHPELARDKESGATLYHELLQKAIVDKLAFTFSHSWEVDIAEFKTAFGQQLTVQPAQDATEPSTKLTLAELDALLKGNRFAASHATPSLGLALPPRSSMTIASANAAPTGMLRGQIAIKNPFVTLTINTGYSMWMRSLGGYRVLMGYSWDQDRDFASAQYIVEIRAQFSRLRSGHPDMPKYKKWVSQIISALRAGLDEQALWSQTRESYLFRKELERLSGVVTPTPPPFLGPIEHTP